MVHLLHRLYVVDAPARQTDGHTRHHVNILPTAYAVHVVNIWADLQCFNKTVFVTEMQTFFKYYFSVPYACCLFYIAILV